MLGTVSQSNAADTTPKKALPIIPQPITIRQNSTSSNEQQNASVFHLSEKTLILTDGAESESDASVFNEFLSANFGFRLKTKRASAEKTAASVIRLIMNKQKPTAQKDAYTLTIKEKEITITGNNAGIFYGLQTILQLLPASANPSLDKTTKTFDLPCCVVEDYPRFGWRGMHLDVSRHFFPKDFVKKYIDLLALYKMNVFHWHLTDDQGWRLEIKKYPKLTSVGAYRKGTLIGHYTNKPVQYDTIRYGGYYTQADAREIVEYARKRHITVVPEIEMPGHASAAVAAYPELASTPGPFEVIRDWGVFKDVFCPKEETFQFLQNVLAEVIAIFPSKYIHIGGDECPKDRWKESAFCQALIKKQGLKDEHELQSYFIQRIEKFVNSKGRQIIGWDEILEGGLAPNAAVMSWRGEKGGIEAAKQRHLVVMSPTTTVYFDYYQSKKPDEPLAIGGFLPLDSVYHYEPIPKELRADEQQYIIGIQANLWTEYIATPEKVEYMLLPRLCALAEVAWTPPAQKNYTGFMERLQQHRRLLDVMKVNYAKSALP
jgi:hexosaminidase